MSGRIAARSDIGRRWAHFTTRRRAAILWSALLLSAVAAPLAARLPLLGDLPHLLPPQTTSVRDLHALEARAQVFGTIIVAIESTDPARRLAAAQSVKDRISGQSDAAVASVILDVKYDNAAAERFAWANRHLLVPTAELVGLRDELSVRKARLNPLYVSLDDEAGTGAAQEPPIGARLRNLKQKLDDARTAAANPTPIVSKDGRLQLVVVRTRFPAGEVSRNAPVLAAVEAAVREIRSQDESVRIGITGDVANTATEHQALVGSMLRATIFTVVIVAGGMLLFFGSAAAVSALLAALALGALLTFAFARLAIGHLNLATAFLAPIVVGNGINFGIILLARYFEERRRTDDPVVALAAAVRGSFPGTLGAALTAAISYASLLATDFRGFRHFGVIGGVGILFCWAATFLVLPAALAALDARGLLRGRSEAPFGGIFARLIPRRSRTIVGATLVIVCGSALGAWHYLSHQPYENDFKNLRSSGAATREAGGWNDKIDHAFGRGISGGTVIALPTRQRASEVATRLRAADLGKSDRQRLFARVATLDDIVPPDQDEKRALLAEIRGLLTEATLQTMDEPDRGIARALIPPAQIADIGDDDVPTDLAWPFTERDGQKGRLVVATTGAAFDLWRTDDLNRFVDSFRALELGSDLVVGGNAFVQHDIERSVSTDGPRATLIAGVGAILVVLTILGLTRQAAVTILCAASGVLLLLCAAGLFGLRINFLDFVALPITIGIGIDYALNIAARHRAEGRGSATRIAAATGPAVALCSYTTVVGYASLLLSENRGIRSFGLAALLGELTCVFGALVLAPALLDFRATGQRPKADRFLTRERSGELASGS